MKSFRQILFKYPEYYLVILALLAVYKQPFLVTAILIGLIVLLVLQIVFQSRIAGLIIGSIFLLLNLYMLGALYSEFMEFTEVNSAAIKLVAVGLPLFIFNLFTTAIMLYKYGLNKKTHSMQTPVIL